MLTFALLWQALVTKCDAEDWPRGGQVTFEKLSLRYAPSEPLRLENISCVIPHGSVLCEDSTVAWALDNRHCRSRVGIVGRTGAGKSSLLAAMFRLAPTEGDIILDDTPSSAIPLEILRRKLSVIPQDPVLFRFDLAVIGIDAKLIAPTQWVSPSKLGPL